MFLTHTVHVGAYIQNVVIIRYNFCYICCATQLAYQMREARLAKAACTELQRRLEEEREKHKEAQNRQNVHLNDEMRLLTDKVTFLLLTFLLIVYHTATIHKRRDSARL